MTHTAHFQRDFVAMQHGQRAAIPICKLLDQLLDHIVDRSNDRLPNRDPDHFSDLEIEFKRSKLVANSLTSAPPTKFPCFPVAQKIDIVPVCGSPG